MRTSRYVTRAAILYQFDTEQQILGGETVFEPDQTHVPTGLIDRQGNPLYRVTDRLPVGFDLNWRSRSKPV